MSQQIIPAQTTLAAINEGRTMLDLATALRDGTQAVRDFNKPAVIKLEIIIQPIKGSGQHLIDQPITMKAEVTHKFPKPEPRTTLFFATDAGPSRQSPERQAPLAGISVFKPTNQAQG